MRARLEWILTTLQLKELLPVFEQEGIDDSLLSGLTNEDLQAIGVEKLGDRKRLLNEFARQVPAGFAAQPRLTKKPSQPAPVQPAADAPKTYSDEPLVASILRPFINSIGIPMVPVGRSKVLFGIWHVRRCDYAHYCYETGAAMPEPDFPQGPDHPVVNVQWNDAHLFCTWLTKRDLWLGLIPQRMAYRLPLDEEWSSAVGLSYEGGATPKSRSGVVEGYPWGGSFPPPRGVGNYHPRLNSDDFPETSPSGSFPANKLGLYDMGGNVWEWCMDAYEPGTQQRVLRGGSCFNDDPLYLMSSYRDHFPADHCRNNLGMRLALAPSTVWDPWLRE